MTGTNPRKVAILGSGLIGRSYAMLFAGVGYQVHLYDIVQAQVQNALADIERQTNDLEKSGLLRGNLSAKAQQALIVGTSSIKDLVKGAFFVMECVPEVLEIKRKALNELDPLMEDGAILASSTSATLPSKLAVGLRHADTFIVTHPVNPPYYVPLVELVPSPWTRPEIIDQTRALMTEIGQSPVTINKEIPGFALNRLQYALMNECYNLVQDGVLTTEDVDIGIRDGVGRRYAFVGGLETCHLNADGMKNYLERYGETIYGVSQQMGPLRKMEGETADEICQSLFRRVPMEKLTDERKRRDEFLMKLSQLRNNIHGLIGSSWAMVFASGGYQVSIYDVDEARIRAALQKIAENLHDLEKAGSLRGTVGATTQQALITGASSLKEAVDGAFFIQESVPELLELKREVLSQVDSLVSDDVIVSSSSSALLPSKLSEGLRLKNRFVVAHPANPPYFVPIVELVPAPWTDPDVVTKTRALMSEVGQSPVVCKKEQAGYALCRLQYAIINECWRLVKDGYMSVEDIDTVMTEGLGRRYALLGPFETAHLNAEGMESYLEKYANMIYEVSSTFGPAPRLEGPTADGIIQDLNKMIPAEKLEARRKWRDDSLAALSKIRKEFD